MNFKKIMLVFSVGLPVCIIARVLQINIAIEHSNGFYFEEFKNFGNGMMLLIGLVALILAICAFKAYKTPEHPPKSNIPLSVSAGVVALSLVYELLYQNIPVTSASWQVSGVKMVTVLAIGYFILLTLSGFVKFKVPSLLHIIPFAYVAVRAIFTFVSISSLALISDNILLMAGYCLLMLFFINYGKLYNKLDTELNFRKILATGLTASLVCATESIPYFWVNFFSTEKYLHADFCVVITALAFGIFTAVFTVSHFYKTV